MVAVPGDEAAKVTEQLAMPALEPAMREHGEPEIPDRPVLVKLTDPDGVVAPEPAESVTVAVHWDD
jgi:hypothetical protein